MKLLLAATLLLTAFSAQAGEPKATLCASQAVEAASALYRVNNPEVTDLRPNIDLVHMDHSEGGSETWDVTFLSEDGQVMNSPYRIDVYVDGCTVYKFTMPFAG